MLPRVKFSGVTNVAALPALSGATYRPLGRLLLARAEKSNDRMRGLSDDPERFSSSTEYISAVTLRNRLAGKSFVSSNNVLSSSCEIVGKMALAVSEKQPTTASTIIRTRSVEADCSFQAFATDRIPEQSALEAKPVDLLVAAYESSSAIGSWSSDTDDEGIIDLGHSDASTRDEDPIISSRAYSREGTNRDRTIARNENSNFLQADQTEADLVRVLHLQDEARQNYSTIAEIRQRWLPRNDEIHECAIFPPDIHCFISSSAV